MERGWKMYVYLSAGLGGESKNGTGKQICWLLILLRTKVIETRNLRLGV